MPTHPVYEATAENEAYLAEHAETSAEAEIIRAVIATASSKAEEEGRSMAIGSHPYFKWICVDGDDDSFIRELGDLRWCDGNGIIPGQPWSGQP